MIWRITFLKSMKTFLFFHVVPGGPALDGRAGFAGRCRPHQLAFGFHHARYFQGRSRSVFSASTRPYQQAVVPNAKMAELNLDSLVMQGISGMPPNRLVIINKHTFAVGDVGEVSTSQGRLHIHCLEINAKSAVIEVNGQRHELRYEEKE